MDKLNILNFDEHILERIFSYVRKRQNIALTCRLFYDLVCKVEKFAHKLVIQPWTLKESFISMNNSLRQFNELDLIAFSLPSLSQQEKKMLGKLVKTVTKARISRVEANQVLHLEVLSLMPQLEILDLNFSDVITNHEIKQETLTLKSLRVLKIKSETGIPYEVINQLPSGVLHNLSLDIKDYNKDLTEFWKLQPNIKSLITNFVKLSQLKNLKLENFSCSASESDCEDLVEFLQSQSNLKSFEFLSWMQTSRVVSILNVARMFYDLQSVSICVEEVTIEIMNLLARLENLNALKLEMAFDDDISLDILTFVTFPRVQCLNLIIKTLTIQSHHLVDLKHAFPVLKSLRVKIFSVCNLCEVLDNLDGLEKFSVDFWYHDEDKLYDFFKPTLNCKIYSEIRELQFEIYKPNLDSRCLSSVVNYNAMPNLQSLAVKGSCRMLFDEQFLKFINNLPSIENLDVEKLRIPGNFNISQQAFKAFQKLSQMKFVKLKIECPRSEIIKMKNFLDKNFDELSYSKSVYFVIRK
ncbi:CLUMA_CG003036, isoform A [Clunio marinus]|uniref:CLUMA_CG003036, isoform A n=1 Tax=Clunio marinus TaxID=568069 RepID=A0A1J1HMK0_9DIPT|nr:CLUMA_CG003036, isoform A [Clunio marinus]